MIFKIFTYCLDPNNILTTPYIHITIQAFILKHNFPEMSVKFHNGAIISLVKNNANFSKGKVSQKKEHSRTTSSEKSYRELDKKQTNKQKNKGETSMEFCE